MCSMYAKENFNTLKLYRTFAFLFQFSHYSLSSLFFGVGIASREFIMMICPDPTAYVHPDPTVYILSGSYRICAYVHILHYMRLS